MIMNRYRIYGIRAQKRIPYSFSVIKELCLMQTMMTTFDNKSRIVGTQFYFMVTLLEKCNLFMVSRPDRLKKKT